LKGQIHFVFKTAPLSVTGVVMGLWLIATALDGAVEGTVEVP